MLPPRTRTVWIRVPPILVILGGRPSSNFLFLRHGVSLPPVLRRLWCSFCLLRKHSMLCT